MIKLDTQTSCLSRYCKTAHFLKYFCTCIALVLALGLSVLIFRPNFYTGLWIETRYSNPNYVIYQDIPVTKNSTYYKKLYRLGKFNITPVLLDPVSLKWLNKAKRNITFRGVESPIVIGITDLKFLRLPVILRRATVIQSILPKEISKSKHPYIVCVKLNIGRTTYLLLALHQTPNFTFVPACDSYQDVREGPWVPSLGKKPLVFDRLLLRKFSIHGLLLAAPNNISKYLLEFPNSIFIKCRRETQNITYYNDPPAVMKTRLEGAVYFKNKLQNLGRFPYLAGGSLLGWYRQCDFIRGTGDFDLSLLSTELDKKLHESIYKDPNISGVTLNLPSDGFQYQLWVLRARIDLFFLYGTSKKDLLYGTGFVKPNSRLGWYYKRSKKCSGVLLGHRFNVPCEVKAAMLYEYGKDWMKQATGWGYGAQGNFKMFPPFEKSKLPYVDLFLSDGAKLDKFFKS